LRAEAEVPRVAPAERYGNVILARGVGTAPVIFLLITVPTSADWLVFRVWRQRGPSVLPVA
jgi:hypothetical protein